MTYTVQGHEVIICAASIFTVFLSYLAEISDILVTSVPLRGGQRGHTVDRR
jgi:hypothetical protein